MHIPDGFIADPRVWGGCYAASLTMLAWSARRVRSSVVREGGQGDRTTLLSGMTGAFLFVAQMFNFPVAGGTSGHLLGGVLACTLLGPWSGMLVVALVLTLQCLLFQDGGITALGANILNMAIVGGGGGYLLYWLLAPLVSARRSRLTLLGTCAGLAVLISAAGAALEIGLSGVVPVRTAMLAMLSVHLPIGLVEGLATAAIIGSLEKLRPDLTVGFDQPSNGWKWAPAALGLGALAILAAAFASSLPDGLEHVASQLGFAAREQARVASPFPGYAVAGSSDLMSRALVALLGLVLAAASAGLAARLLHRLRHADER